MGNLSTDMKFEDLLPIFRTPLLDGTTIVPLTSVTTATLIITRPDETVIERVMIIESPPENGIVNYPWAVGDLTMVGDYHVEVELTFANGKKQTFPAKGYGVISVHEDLD